eukprot:3941101-Rhodomonas_salina.2
MAYRASGRGGSILGAAATALWRTRPLISYVPPTLPPLSPTHSLRYLPYLLRNPYAIYLLCTPYATSSISYAQPALSPLSPTHSLCHFPYLLHIPYAPHISYALPMPSPVPPTRSLRHLRY